MADILWAYSIGEDVNGNQITVQIWGPDDGRGAVEFTAGFPLCNLIWTRNEEAIYTDPLMFSEANINIIVESSIQQALIAEIAGSQANVHAVQILLNSNRYWTGLLLPETITQDVSCDPLNVNIRAADGLRALEDFNSHDPQNSMAVNLFTILDNLVNWQFYDPALKSIFFQQQFTIFGASGQVFTDCEFQGIFENDFDYLRAILNDLGMYMVHANGYYYLIGLIDITSGSFSGTWYKQTGAAAVSSETLNYSTVDVDIDTGGVLRYTRPYLGVYNRYQRSADVGSLFADAAYSPDENSDFLTLHSEVVSGYYPKDYTLNIEYTATIKKTTGSDLHYNEILWIVKYGVYYYYADTKEWSISTLGYAHSQLVTNVANDEVIINGTFEIPIGEAITTLGGLLDIQAGFNITDENGVAQNVVNNFEIAIKATFNKNVDQFYQTGTAAPQLEIEHYFNNNAVVKLDKIYSNSLAAFVDDLWEYSGYARDYLHIVRSEAIADLVLNSEPLYEVFADKLDGPAIFYRILNTHKLLPVRVEQDMQRREGTIIGLKV